MATQMEAAPRRHKAGWALGVLMAGVLLAGAAGASTGGRFADVEVYDRQDGSTLAVYEKDGRRYVVGTPGHEYSLRVRNLTGSRILAVTSVDGVNVVSGETASPDQSGYVLDAWGSVEIAGWRKSLQRTAAFYFTDLGASHAARTGRPGNVGVIGVAVFREKAPIQRERISDEPILRREAESAGTAQPAPALPPATAPAGAAAEAAPAQRAKSEAGSLASAADVMEKRRAAKPEESLGTGHGAREASNVTYTRFERNSDRPDEVVSLWYDSYRNLVAAGVLPPPPRLERDPQPFPNAFVPDPSH